MTSTSPTSSSKASTVRRVLTTREGGVSRGPYASFNLGDHVGDDPAAVAANRARLVEATGVDAVVWMEQTHSANVRRRRAGRAAGPARRGRDRRGGHRRPLRPGGPGAVLVPSRPGHRPAGRPDLGGALTERAREIAVNLATFRDRLTRACDRAGR